MTVKRGGFPLIKKKDIIYPLQSLVQSHLYGPHYFCIQDPKYKNAKDQQDEVLKSNLRLLFGLKAREAVSIK
jgi:hypothetical protein